MGRYVDDVAVGIIGVGGMGARHADNLCEFVPGARVAAVADRARTRAGEVAARYGSKVFDDPRDLIADGGIDAVVIASPDETHAPLTLECIRHRKPVLCEKPVATTVADALRIAEAESRLGAKLVQVGFMRRYDPRHRAVADAVVDGAIGRPVLFKGWHRGRRSAPGVSTEFVVRNSAVHDLDAVRWLLRQEIDEVYVRGVNTDRSLGEVLDLQVIQLSTAEGCLATLEIYVTAGYGYEVGVELVGEHGTVHVAPPDTPFIRSDRGRLQRLDAEWLGRFQTAYVAELVHWVGGVRDGVVRGPDAWDGYLAAVAADACLASLRRGTSERVSNTTRPVLYQGCPPSGRDPIQ